MWWLCWSMRKCDPNISYWSFLWTLLFQFFFLSLSFSFCVNWFFFSSSFDIFAVNTQYHHNQGVEHVSFRTSYFSYLVLVHRINAPNGHKQCEHINTAQSYVRSVCMFFFSSYLLFVQRECHLPLNASVFFILFFVDVTYEMGRICVSFNNGLKKNHLEMLDHKMT